MAYPSTIDSFAPDPSPGSPRNNPSLAGKVTALSTSVVAVETFIGTSGVAAGPGTLNGRVKTLEAAPGGAPASVCEVLTATSFASYARFLSSSGGTTSFTAGHSYLWSFTCPLSFTTANINLYVGTGGSGSTIQELSLYSMDGADAGTRIAVTASNLSWTTTGLKTYPWGSPVSLTAGARYCVAQYQNAGTGPGFLQLNMGATQAIQALRTPMSSGFLSGARIGASFVKASIAANGQYAYFELTN